MQTKPCEDLKTVAPTSGVSSPPLRPKQQAFVEQVLIKGNATRAAREAGYSPRTARSIAAENLTKPVIRDAIQAARRSVSEQAGIEAVEVLRLAKHIASADPGLLVDEMGNPVPLGELPYEVRVALQSVQIFPVKFDENGRATAHAYRFRFADKNAALDKLFRHLGLYEKGNRQADGGVRALMEAVQASGTRLPLKT